MGTLSQLRKRLRAVDGDRDPVAGLLERVDVQRANARSSSTTSTEWRFIPVPTDQPPGDQACSTCVPLGGESMVMVEAGTPRDPSHPTAPGRLGY